MSQAAMKAKVPVQEQKTGLGFWLYLMTDCMLFATLFVTFVVVRNSVAGGPSGHDIFQIPTVVTETLILLTSSFACGLAILAMKQQRTKVMLTFLAVTYILGVAFLTIELNEFGALISAGHSWQQSAFLSSFFTLVGTHGAHILTGLIWLVVLVSVLIKRGLSEKLSRQFVLFSLFWHFLDLVWIFIFTIVYLLGVV
jgi:cytochrome o ubiquinol oxidase subunit 3